MILAIVPALVLIVGALTYGLSNNGKLAELGRIGFEVGLFWTVATVAGHIVRIT